MKQSQYNSYDDLPLFLNADMVAKVLGVSSSTSYELMHEPDFPVLNVGSRMVVPKWLKAPKVLLSSAFGPFCFRDAWSLALSAPLFPSARFPVWVTVWVKQFLAVIRCLSEEADPLLYHFGTPRFNNAHDVP